MSDAKYEKAKNLASSENYEEMKRFVQKVGTNPKFLDKSISFSFLPPWDFLALRNAQSQNAEAEQSANELWWSLYQKVRTHFQQNPD